MKKRRFQADVSEDLLIALAIACEHAAISKSQFAHRALVVALRQYCDKNPELANKSLLNLLREAEEHLLE